MIIDSHTHFQYSASNMFMFGYDDESMLRWMETLGCDYAIQSTSRALDRYPCEEAHENYAAFAKELYEKSGGKVMSYFVYDPRMAEIDLKVIEENHDHPAFRGIKIHPSDHGVWAYDDGYRACWEAARKYNLPIMSHTWALTSNPKQKYATPEQFVKFLEEYPDVTFIFGHSGGRTPGIKVAAEIGRTHKNAYFDLAGDIYNRHLIEYMVNMVGADHLLGASDVLWFDLSMVIGMVLGANITSEEKALILGGNAARIFKIA